MNLNEVLTIDWSIAQTVEENKIVVKNAVGTLTIELVIDLARVDGIVPHNHYVANTIMMMRNGEMKGARLHYLGDADLVEMLVLDILFRYNSFEGKIFRQEKRPTLSNLRRAE